MAQARSQIWINRTPPRLSDDRYSMNQSSLTSPAWSRLAKLPEISSVIINCFRFMPHRVWVCLLHSYSQLIQHLFHVCFRGLHCSFLQSPLGWASPSARAVLQTLSPCLSAGFRPPHPGYSCSSSLLAFCSPTASSACPVPWEGSPSVHLPYQPEPLSWKSLSFSPLCPTAVGHRVGCKQWQLLRACPELYLYYLTERSQ